MDIAYIKTIFEKKRVDYTFLKNSKVFSNSNEPSYGRKNDFDEHLLMLRDEFNSKSLLEFYFVYLTVKIRRAIEIEKSKASFIDLWQSEKFFLIHSLNTRWLVSACDTFIDISTDPLIRSYALGGSIYANLLKLFETEKMLFKRDDTKLIESIGNTLTPIFDGMTAYNIKNGDMIQNLLKRIFSTIDKNVVTGEIYIEIIKRSLKQETILKRLLECHNHREEILSQYE